MSQLFFDPIHGFVPLGDDHAPWTTLIDPILARVHERDRWETRAAQWRARHLAEAVFGGEVEARLGGRASGGPFRGLLHLHVPFAALPDHRAREALFLAAAARDPVLARVPFLYVFGAEPAPALTETP
jgi:hypothetical protein